MLHTFTGLYAIFKGTPLRLFDMTGLKIVFEINIPFDAGLDQLLVCKVSDHLLTLFFQDNYSYCAK
jgi:hypothetical protein